MAWKLLNTIFLRALNLNLVSILVLITLCTSTGATEIYWSNPSGGTFQEAANWDDSVPGVDDTAIFNTGGNTYTVDMAADQTNYQMEVNNDNVTLNLNDSTHTITQNWSRAYIGKDAGDNATLTLTDGTADYTREVSVGVNAGASGVLRVDDATLNTDSFKVGEKGTGTAIIENGAQVNINYNTQGRVWVGLGDNATGILAVNGAGSRLYGTGGAYDANGPLITVGGVYHTDTTAKGFLTAINGGVVEGAKLTIADRGAEGTVKVSGEGSSIDIDESVYVSSGGKGILEIVNSGLLSARSLYIGDYAGGEGIVKVSGENSRLEIDSSLSLWSPDNSSLTVEDSATISSRYLNIGQEASNGEHIISLKNGGVATAHSLNMHGPSAKLNITGGGSMSISGEAMTSAYDDANNSVITVNGSGSRLDIGSNLFLGGYSYYEPGEGTYSFHGGTATLNVEDNSRVSVANTLQLFGDAVVNLNSVEAGVVTVGEVSADPAAYSGSMLIGSGGILSGRGTINGDVYNLGGTIAPGFSPGIMTINGDFHLGSSGILDLEIGGLAAGLYDQLLVSGDVFLDGTLNLIFIDDFLPKVDDLLTDLITFDELTFGSNFNLTFSGLNNDWQYEKEIGQTSFGFRSLSDASAPVPEPSTLLLLSGGVIGLACYTRKRKNKNERGTSDH